MVGAWLELKSFGMMGGLPDFMAWGVIVDIIGLFEASRGETKAPETKDQGR